MSFRPVFVSRAVVLAAGVFLLAIPGPAAAVDVEGVVSLEGTLDASEVAGVVPGTIPFTDIVVSVGDESESTSNHKCTVSAQTSDTAAVGGTYPDAGSVSVNVLMEKGGPQVPDGACILNVRARGDDGVATSVRGSGTAYATATEVGGAQTMTGIDIVLRQSRIVAGVSKDCLTWAKKQAKFRAKCNFLLLKKGPEAADKCKVADPPEPLDCDPGNYVEAILDLSHGGNDQQLDPMSADLLGDWTLLKSQIKCQKLLGKAAVNFMVKQTKLIQKKCVEAGIDDESCRSDQAKVARKKLGVIDKCVDPVAADLGGEFPTGRVVPQIGGGQCDSCINGVDIDRKCLQSCFETILAGYSDGIVGDVPECGNGVVQSPETCDDGNQTSGDCCSDSCAVEPAGSQTCGIGECEVTVAECSAGEPVICVPDAPGVEGPGGATCSDGLDNDCDGLTDAADVVDCP